MKTGVNLFGLAGLMRDDFEGTLQTLKDSGFTALEPCILFDEGFQMSKEAVVSGMKKRGLDGAYWLASEAKEKIDAVRRVGLEVTGAHIFLLQFIPGGFDAILPQMLETAEENDLRYYVYCPMIGQIDEMKEKLPSVQRAAAALNEANVDLLFHNHESELEDEGGDCVFDFLMREVPQMKLEPDVGWVLAAGVDPVALMKKYNEKIRIIHFKDLDVGKVKADRDHCFRAVGEGDLPLQRILEYVRRLPLYETGYIIDQDASEGDMIEDLRIGIRSLNYEK